MRKSRIHVGGPLSLILLFATLLATGLVPAGLFPPAHAVQAKTTGTDDPTVDPSFGKVGRQQNENTGPLTVKRMETIDDEFTDTAAGRIDKQVKAGRPFVCWYDFTRIHMFTHLKPESQCKTGPGLEAGAPRLYLPIATAEALGNNQRSDGSTPVALTAQGPTIAGVTAHDVPTQTGALSGPV